MPARTAGACGSFFFQAEDGIRDLIVTGVQTCALPICQARSPRAKRGAALLWFYGNGENVGAIWDIVVAWQPPGVGVLVRSEERRVGKEGRSRGSPYH